MGTNRQNVRAFELGLKKWSGEVVPERVGQYQRAVVLEALRGVVMMSPVDTGFFRSRWRVYSDGDVVASVLVDSLASAMRRHLGSSKNMAQITAMQVIGAAMDEIQKVRPFTLTGIVNDAPYADELEQGHSKQAPQGMVAVTAQRLRSRGYAK
jgi:hypothetical protein